MKTWTFYFHKGAGKDESFKRRFISWLIKKTTHGDVSHAELQREDGLCFSADGYKNIVDWRDIQFTNPGRWIAIRMPPVSDEEDANKVARAAKLKGHKYDTLGAIFSSSRWHRNIEDPNKNYCSEACAIVYGALPAQVPPIDLLEWCMVNKGMIVPVLPRKAIT